MSAIKNLQSDILCNKNSKLKNVNTYNSKYLNINSSTTQNRINELHRKINIDKNGLNNPETEKEFKDIALPGLVNDYNICDKDGYNIKGDMLMSIISRQIANLSTDINDKSLSKWIDIANETTNTSKLPDNDFLTVNKHCKRPPKNNNDDDIIIAPDSTKFFKSNTAAIEYCKKNSNSVKKQPIDCQLTAWEADKSSCSECNIPITASRSIMKQGKYGGRGCETADLTKITNDCSHLCENEDDDEDDDENDDDDDDENDDEEPNKVSIKYVILGTLIFCLFIYMSYMIYKKSIKNNVNFTNN